MRGLKDKVVIVTGGGGGIGHATCKRFGEEGAKVAVFDINGDTAEATAAAVRDAGGTAQAFTVDLTDHDAVKAAVADAEAKLGPIDVLVNNAGWDRFTPFVKSTPDYWDKIIAINLKSVLNMMHAVLPGMGERGGRIVTVASDAGRVGSSGESVYSACKGGLIALTKTLAREHSRQGITFNTVCPGLTETAMFGEFLEGAGNPDKLREAFRRAVPLGRIGQPDDLPGAICFLASEDAAFITGQTISVSGGLTMHG
ncbi:MAG: glucose 1-dehydrogenase [Hyphomicrobiales bacterium]|nr:glucose 1-dehydrogenase [Hyphomicrobiales bacterium]